MHDELRRKNDEKGKQNIRLSLAFQWILKGYDSNNPFGLLMVGCLCK